MSGPTPSRVVVLASGGGSNFQALIDRFEGESGDVLMSGLVASREGAGALDRAARHSIETSIVPEPARRDREAEAAYLLDRLGRWSADLVVLAGYMRLIPEEVVRTYRGRMVNIHPALLPAFGGEGMYGAHVHRAVVDAGVRVTGVTVHFVDEAYDRGPIIAQWPVPILASDRPEDVAARVLAVEHRLLPEVVGALARGQVRLDEDGVVCWTSEWYRGERFEMRSSDDESNPNRE